MKIVRSVASNQSRVSKLIILMANLGNITKENLVIVGKKSENSFSYKNKNVKVID